MVACATGMFDAVTASNMASVAVISQSPMKAYRMLPFDLPGPGVITVSAGGPMFMGFGQIWLVARNANVHDPRAAGQCGAAQLDSLDLGRPAPASLFVTAESVL